jgi:hypothetical protein
MVDPDAMPVGHVRARWSIEGWMQSKQM